MTAAAPDVITRYFAATDDKDPAACAACFTADGTVFDEDVTYVGRDEIVRWRTETLGRWTYTSTITGSEHQRGPSGSQSAGAQEYLVYVHIEGDFPGGVADLTFTFVTAGDLISSLRIG